MYLTLSYKCSIWPPPAARTNQGDRRAFSPYTNILCPATVGTTIGCFWERACTARCEIFYGKHVALWPQNWSGHRTLFAEVLPFWDSMLWAAGRIEWAGGEEGARLSTLLATIRNVKTTLFVMACDSFRGVACVLRNKASKLVHSLWKTLYYTDYMAVKACLSSVLIW
jgi:hypothetical protein